jgi:hypothetical protein
VITSHVQRLLISCQVLGVEPAGLTDREARQDWASRASGCVLLRCQQPVAGWRNPGNGLRSPMRV